MNNSLLFSFSIYATSLIVPTVAFWVISYLVAHEYKDIKCDGHKMDLSYWLFADNTLNIVYCIVGACMIYMLYKKGTRKYFICFGLITFLYMAASIVSDIIGIINIYHFNMECHNVGTTLWRVSIVSITFQTITLIITSCVLYCNRNNIVPKKRLSLDEQLNCETLDEQLLNGDITDFI